MSKANCASLNALPQGAQATVDGARHISAHLVKLQTKTIDAGSCQSCAPLELEEQKRGIPELNLVHIRKRWLQLQLSVQVSVLLQGFPCETQATVTEWYHAG